MYLCINNSIIIIIFAKIYNIKINKYYENNLFNTLLLLFIR